MIPQEVFAVKDFQRCVDFHGHVCPGLAIGYRAAKAGLNWLKENRAGDEELGRVIDFSAAAPTP